MKTLIICVILVLISSCALDVGSTAQQVGTCVSDPLAPGSSDGDVVPQCPPPGMVNATANALAVAANHIHVSVIGPPPGVDCNDQLQRCTTFLWLDPDDLTYLRTTCAYGIPVICSSDVFQWIDGRYQIILSF